MKNDCIFSPDRKYRYVLRHRWEDLLPEKACMWIGLNPSTADENQLDPTLRRIKGYSHSWAYNCFYMCNLFAFRATLPKDMKREPYPIGCLNDQEIVRCAEKCDLIVACWGADGKFKDRAEYVISMLKDESKQIFCIGKTKDGFPKHPLYVSKQVKLELI
jgi:hypothetical protein